jgi:hypothetical protein
MLFPMNRCCFLIFFIFVTFSAKAFELRSFSTDYCTNYPEGTRARPELWKHCCLIHDLNFWAGGSSRDRKTADLQLRTCIEDTGAVSTAWLMYLGVRAGSFSPIKYSDKRWGNGWPGRKMNLPLTLEEVERIDLELGQDSSIPFPIKNDFLRSLYLRLDEV